MKNRCGGIVVVLYVLLTGMLLGGCGNDNAETDIETEQDQQEFFVTAEEDAYVPVVEAVFSEETSYPMLEDFLIAYYQIPEEYLAETRYYYNYTDINDDGAQEIFAVVIGDYTEAKNGNPAVILSVDETGAFLVVESFPSVRTPITISNDTTNGWHDIIYYTYGGDEDDGYRICRYNPNGGYKTELSEIVRELKPVGGIQILSNNLIDDMDQGRYLTLE